VIHFHGVEWIAVTMYHSPVDSFVRIILLCLVKIPDSSKVHVSWTMYLIKFCNNQKPFSCVALSRAEALCSSTYTDQPSLSMRNSNALNRLCALNIYVCLTTRVYSIHIVDYLLFPMLYRSKLILCHGLIWVILHISKLLDQLLIQKWFIWGSFLLVK